MYQIRFQPDALNDYRRLRKYDQQQIARAIDTQLPHEPDRETQNRKRLRPNSLAEWELRLGRFRVFYDLDQPGGSVLIVAIGEKKGDRLFIRGQEHDL
jgi:mRNA-degrading endonuclease RelE of RelBE toxin-antitoxin system